jgi:hypothetical protein
MPLSLDDIIAQMEQSADEARAANLKRQSQAYAIYDEIIARYGPEGSFGAAAEAQLERQKVRDVASGTQGLVSSGLYGTTNIAGLGKAWEEEVGEPARLRLEDMKMERLSQAQLGKATFTERIEDEYPDYGLAAQLAAQASNRPSVNLSTSYGGGGGYTGSFGTYDTYTPGGGQAGRLVGTLPSAQTQPTGGTSDPISFAPLGGIYGDIAGLTPEQIAAFQAGQGPVSHEYGSQIKQDVFSSLDPMNIATKDWSTASHAEKIAEGKRLRTSRSGSDSSNISDASAMRYFQDAHRGGHAGLS